MIISLKKQKRKWKNISSQTFSWFLSTFLCKQFLKSILKKKHYLEKTHFKSCCNNHTAPVVNIKENTKSLILFFTWNEFCDKCSTESTRKMYHHENALRGPICKLNFINVSTTRSLMPRVMHTRLNRSSHPEVFLGRGVMKICIKFTGRIPMPKCNFPWTEVSSTQFTWMRPTDPVS